MLGTKRERGNEEFKNGNFKEAISIYTEVIDEMVNESSNLQSDEYIRCLNNRCLCYLKISKYEKALEDANLVLSCKPGDLKAMFRRSQSYKELQKYQEAIKDAKTLISLDPKNQEFITHMKSLICIIDNKASEQNSLGSKTKLMIDIIDEKVDGNILNALNNMVVLAKEKSGANELMAAGAIRSLKKYLDTSDSEKVLATTRVLSTLCKNSCERSLRIIQEITSKKISELLCYELDSVSTAAASLIQNIILSITDLENKRKTKKPINIPFEFSKETQSYINEIFRSLIGIFNEPTCSAFGRDNAIDLCLKNFDNAIGCGWTSRFIILGLQKLLLIAAYLPEFEKNLKITENTKLHVACCLNAIYEDISSDKEREDYISICDSFIRDLCEKEDELAKVKAIACLDILLQGPFDVGNALVGKNNLIQMMLNMANSDEPIRQKIAVEAIVFSASKKDKATGILTEGLDILKKLYLSANQQLKVRALTGLCKLSSSKGSDASVKLLAEGANLKLEKACRKFICDPASDYDTKKWAADGLAYLTLDGDIKEEVIDDLATIKELYELIKKGDKNTLYSISTIIANLANAYEVKKPSEELIELAKYAKYHVPEIHEKDKEQYIERRRQKLMDSGVAQALVAMAKYDNQNCNEAISHIFSALCKDVANRGAVVAAGGGKVLIPMALKGTEKGKTKASQALAAITITINPEISFPGQRCVEVVRPLINLLHPDKTALENFEALMALTNLAQVNEATRKSMLKENGFSCIEQYMFEEHPMLRRAATECICNLVQEEEVAKYFVEENNDRVKLLVLFCGEDDPALNVASSGTLAQISLDNETICRKILQVESFFGVFKECACNSDIEFQYRIFYILNNITSISKELCSKVVESDLMDVIVALSRLSVEKERKKVKDLAIAITKKSLEFGLIKPALELNSINEDTQN